MSLKEWNYSHMKSNRITGLDRWPGPTHSRVNPIPCER